MSLSATSGRTPAASLIATALKVPTTLDPGIAASKISDLQRSTSVGAEPSRFEATTPASTSTTPPDPASVSTETTSATSLEILAPVDSTLWMGALESVLGSDHLKTSATPLLNSVPAGTEHNIAVPRRSEMVPGPALMALTAISETAPVGSLTATVLKVIPAAPDPVTTASIFSDVLRSDSGKAEPCGSETIAPTTASVDAELKSATASGLLAPVVPA